MALENEIAILERQLSSAKTEGTKKLLSDKIGRLKVRLEDASSKGEARTKVAIARTKVKQMPLNKFKAYIKQLAKKPQYKFLKGLTTGQISDDKKRVAKPVGWRFSGRENMKKPTKAEIREGKKDGSVYYENRSIRSDVSRAVRLENGGVSGSTIEVGGVGVLSIHLVTAEDDVDHLVYALFDNNNNIVKTDFEDTESAKMWAKENGYNAIQYANGNTIKGGGGVEDEEELKYVELSNGDIVVAIRKKDGQWHEADVLEGKEPYGWGGKTYMGYLKPKDIAQWLGKDYGGYFEIVDQYANGGGVGDFKVGDKVKHISDNTTGKIKEITKEGMIIWTKDEDGFDEESTRRYLQKMKTGGGVGESTKNILIEKLIDDNLDFRNDLYPYHRDEQLTEIAKKYGYIKDKNVANSLGYLMYFDLQSYFLGKYGGNTYKSGAKDWEFKTGGSTALSDNGDDYLGLVFSTDAQYKEGKKFYDGDSVFYADDFSDEFRTLFFKVEQNDSFDTLEFELERELQETDLDGWYFTQEEFMAGGKTRANRPSPSISATSVYAGSKEFGNDGNIYQSRADKNGVQRWIRISAGEKKEKKSKSKVESKQKFLAKFLIRKASDWEDGDGTLNSEELDEMDTASDWLQTLPIIKIENDSPLDDFPASVKKEVNGNPFIAMVSKEAYYVDPQGNDYARYILNVTGFNNPKEKKSDEYTPINFEVGDKFTTLVSRKQAVIYEIESIDIRGVFVWWIDKSSGKKLSQKYTKSEVENNFKKDVFRMYDESEHQEDNEDEQTDEIMRILDLVNNGKWGKGLKEGMRDDFHRSGFTDFVGLVGKDEAETSKNIQQNIMGFNSGKNTNLQADMIARSIHQDRGLLDDPLGEVTRLIKLYLEGVEADNNATKRSAIAQLTFRKDTYEKHPDQKELLFGKPYSFYTKEYKDALEFIKAFGGDKFAIGGTFKGGGNMNVENCERCNQPTGNATTMSMFNEDVICMSCKEKEKQHPDYNKAVDTDNAEIKKGNYNFKGIGKDVLEVELGSTYDAERKSGEDIALYRRTADSLHQAQMIVSGFITWHNVGASTWIGGDVYKNGKLYKRISYNGKLQDIKMGAGGTSDSAEDMGAPMIIGTMESSMENGGKIGKKSGWSHKRKK